MEELKQLLTRREEVIADHTFRDRDSEKHLAELIRVSEEINSWYEANKKGLDSQLHHFLVKCSYSKALEYIS